MSDQEHHSSDPFIDSCFRHNSKKELLEEREIAKQRKLRTLRENLTFSIVSTFIVGLGIKYMIKARAPAGPALRQILAQKNPVFRRGIMFASTMATGSLFAYVHYYNMYWGHAHNNPYAAGHLPNLDEVYGIKDLSTFDGTI